MMNVSGKWIFIFSLLLFQTGLLAQQTACSGYLDPVKAELNKKWPHNKTINIVFHGHSVPSGYFATPQVNTLKAYPHLTLCAVKEKYPNAVVNVITTSIGGEQSEQGALRFENEVLCHRPDVLYIDYALNDRGIGILRSETAWRKMIEAALKYGCKIILMTPTPDLTEDIKNDHTPLQQHSEMIRRLAVEYNVGLVDSYKAFRDLANKGENIKMYMSQSNHPNEKGHEVVAQLLGSWY
ncbi:MAG: SGNH/GDSL hydrolase family protein [Paludibacter sp.]|nr:SGNH/GDSL hydrolase family protein [Paludibacter sp.]